MAETIENLKEFENKIVESLARTLEIPVELLRFNFATGPTLSGSYCEYQKQKVESFNTLFKEVERRIFKQWRMSLCRDALRRKRRLVSTRRNALVLFYNNN